jgi:hypothetical protein
MFPWIQVLDFVLSRGSSKGRRRAVRNSGSPWPLLYNPDGQRPCSGSRTAHTLVDGSFAQIQIFQKITVRYAENSIEYQRRSSERRTVFPK